MKRIWLKLRYNWFTVGLHCARKGHAWRTMRVGGVYRMQDGVFSVNRAEMVELTDCGWCGKFRGYRRVDS